MRESLDLLELEGMLPEQWPALHTKSFPTSNPLLISSSALPAQLVKDKVQGRTAVGAGEIAGGEEEIGDDEAVGNSFGADGLAAMENRDTGNRIEDQEVAGNTVVTDDGDERGEKGMDIDDKIEDEVGAKEKAGDEEEMDDEGVMGANPEVDGIAEEGTDTGDMIEDWEAVGNKVAGDDVDDTSEEGLDTEDEMEVAVGAEDMADDEEEIGDEGEMGETSEMDVDAGMEGTDTSTGRTLRPRRDTRPDFKLHGPRKTGFKEDGPRKPPPLKKPKKMVPNMQDGASSLPGSYALPIDVDAWTRPEPDINLHELEAPNLVSFLSPHFTLLIVLLHQ